mgnify:CR=1 FL=1
MTKYTAKKMAQILLFRMIINNEFYFNLNDTGPIKSRAAIRSMDQNLPGSLHHRKHHKKMIRHIIPGFPGIFEECFGIVLVEARMGKSNNSRGPGIMILKVIPILVGI